MVTLIKKLLLVGLQGPSIAVEKSVKGAALSHVSESQLQTKVPLSLSLLKRVQKIIYDVRAS
jgi:hypothetical protein